MWLILMWLIHCSYSVADVWLILIATCKKCTILTAVNVQY